MAELYHQASQQGVWTVLGPPTSCAVQLGQALSITYADGSTDSLAAHSPAVAPGAATQVDRTSAVWVVYVHKGDGVLRLCKEQDLAQLVADYAPLARVLADRVVPYQLVGPDVTTLAATSESYLVLTVTNNAATTIGGSGSTPVGTSSTDYVVQAHLAGSTAVGVWNALADRTSFTDLKVLYGGAEIDTDVDVQTNGSWSSSNQTLWFRLQRPIAAGAHDSGYQLRVGGPLRSSPPRNWANIYPFSDDFLGSSLSGTWSVLGGPSIAVSSSVVTVSSTTTTANQLINSSTTFGTGYEARFWALLPANTDSGGHSQSMVGLTAGTPHPHQEVYSAYTAVYYGLDNATTTTATLGPAPDGAYHCYSVARAADSSGSAYFSAAGTTAGPITSNSSTAALGPMVWAFRDFAGTVNTSVSVDWVKVRPFVSAEPSVVAGTLQSAGGLRWEPVVDSSGSVLIAPSGDPIMALVATS